MVAEKSYDVIIVGGGLAGLSSALHLSQNGVKVLLIEKHRYPHHKVCGEYVSNEVLPYLNTLGIDPFSKGAVAISNFEISTQQGKTINTELPLGGFGISRFTLDALMFNKVSASIDSVFDSAESIHFHANNFEVRTQSKGVYKAPFVLGAYGKRSHIDKSLSRPFFQQKSPWLAVKAHFDASFPENKVALHNFEGGYCGLSNIETGAVNTCYLTTYASFKKVGDINRFQQSIMSANPHLSDFFSASKLLFEQPLTISQISFQKKEPVARHIFMIGDSAGLIHPLCGNGMAMAIHSAKLFSELFLQAFSKETVDRIKLENDYIKAWKETFQNRLQTGRMIQRLLLHPSTANIGLKVARLFPAVVPRIIKKTHGELLV